MRYYDFVLSGIMFSLAAGATIGFITSVPLNVSLAASSLVSSGLMYHGMFARAPTEAF
ncbi:MAG: hypothetical protein ABEJ99_05195 [Candidatus Nanohaloarchaea archaeon]